MINAAQEILDEFGRSATYTVYTNRTYNPLTGVIGSTATNHSAQTAVLALSRSYFENSVVKDAHCALVLAAKNLTFTPTVGTRVELEGKVFVVLKVNRYFDKGQIVLYILVVRE